MNNLLRPLGWLLLLPLSLQAAPSANGKKMQAAPFSFIENAGQITGNDSKSRTDIDVKLKARDVSIFIGDGQIHYLWKKKVPTGKHLSKDTNPKPLHEEREEYVLETYRMDVELVGANTNAEPVKENRQEYYENYFLPQCPGGVTAHSYSKIIYKNIYHNIDWVLYAGDNGLKYDFVVRPGGRASDIRLRYKGATSLRMKNGAVTARTPMGSITEKKPYSYDAVTKEEVPSSFVLNGDELRFAVAASENTIVIDPVLAWGSYFGDANLDDELHGMSVDSAGNIFVAGETASSNKITFPGVGNPYQATLAGNSDAFIAKFNNDGKLIWSTYYGGSQRDLVNDLALHSNGNIYILGTTMSPGGIASLGPVHQQQHGGQYDAFVAVFTPNGGLVWGSYFGGSLMEFPGNLAINKSGDVYITGTTASTNAIATAGAFQDTLCGPFADYDAFLAKFSAAGSLIWGTYLGGQYSDGAEAIALDAQENVFLGGSTKGGIHCTLDAEDSSLQVNTLKTSSAFITKFSSQGALLYSSHYNSALSPNDLCIDLAGNAYMTTDSIQVSRIVKLNNAGKVQWVRGWGGFRIRMGNDGNVYTAGIAWIPGMATPGSYQTMPAGMNDGFIARYDTAGNKLWASFYGGMHRDPLMGFAIDKKNRLYVCGYTESPNNIATPGAHKDTWTGNFPNSDDGFIAKWHDTIASVGPVIDTVVCSPDTISVPYKVLQAEFGVGNTFTAQLSDASGSFVNPVDIGSVVSSTDDIIPCIIPASTPPGTGYRIRIVASAPAFITEDNGKDIRVLERPNPTITGKTAVCANEPISLAATTVGPTTSYTWKLPSGNTVTGTTLQLPKATDGDAGHYILTAGNEGCADEAAIDITIHPRPQVVKLTHSGPVCEGNMLSMSVESSMSNVSYKWIGPKGYTSTDNDPVITGAKGAQHTGQYSVFLTSNKGCVSDTASFYTEVIKLEAHVNGVELRTPGDTINLQGSSNVDSVTWSWKGPDGFTSDIQNPIIEDISAAQRGEYHLTVSKNGCKATASVNVSVVEVVIIKLFPNPNNGNFTIKGNTLKDQTIDMEITDAMGKAIYRDQVTTFRKHFTKTISLPVRPATGVYVLRLNVAGKDSDVKFVIME